MYSILNSLKKLFAGCRYTERLIPYCMKNKQKKKPKSDELRISIVLIFEGSRPSLQCYIAKSEV